MRARVRTVIGGKVGAMHIRRPPPQMEHPRRGTGPRNPTMAVGDDIFVKGIVVNLLVLELAAGRGDTKRCKIRVSRKVRIAGRMGVGFGVSI